MVLAASQARYRAQQSIRTFRHEQDASRLYIKTALSIQNMGFMRGLSPAYMAATPAINDWVADLVEGDAELTERGLSEADARADDHPGARASRARPGDRYGSAGAR